MAPPHTDVRCLTSHTYAPLRCTRSVASCILYSTVIDNDIKNYTVRNDILNGCDNLR